MTDNRTTPDGWIDVRDRLPEPSVYVLTYDVDCPLKEYDVACWRPDRGKKGMWTIYGGIAAVVTHWVPLPAPPVTL